MYRRDFIKLSIATATASAYAPKLPTPSAAVVPVHWASPSGLMIETFAPATGAPLARRVTKTSVFCGLSFTVMPRLVTWIRLARVNVQTGSVDKRRFVGLPVPGAAAMIAGLALAYSYFEFESPRALCARKTARKRCTSCISIELTWSCPTSACR